MVNSPLHFQIYILHFDFTFPLPPFPVRISLMKYCLTILLTLNQFTMRVLLLCLTAGFLFLQTAGAQSGCPGCIVDLPANLPADTVYLPDLPDGKQGTPYDENISFRLPLTTTPVNAVDSTIPPGIAISAFEIISVSGLPAGINWEANQTTFDTDEETDGCIRLCGTPLVKDSFTIIVTLEATVFGFPNLTTFPKTLYIAPKISSTPGFAMTNPVGCGETTVEFTNNIPSNGNPGFTYEWDLGDGSNYTGETPPPHTYDQPGMYVVTYHATIDTIGHILNSVTVLNADCSDPFNAPDLYLFIEDSEGMQIFNSSPAVNNTNLPWEVTTDLLLDNSNYSVFVYDEDSGIKGSDDFCGSIPFNLLSGDTLSSGGFTVVLDIIHPVEEYMYSDTVIVYPQPAPPNVDAPMGLSACEGDNGLVLVSSYGAGNQWFLNGSEIQGASDFIYMPLESGFYQVMVTTQGDCFAVSDSVEIVFNPLPDAPNVLAPNGTDGCAGADSILLQSTYLINNQWLFNGDTLMGETSQQLYAQEDGFYQVIHTNQDGCAAISDSFGLTFIQPPVTAQFFHQAMSNYLYHIDTTTLPQPYEVQWYFEGSPIPGANGTVHCMDASGVYGFEVIDLNTGCSTFFENTESFDPQYECATSIDEQRVGTLKVYPVPATETIWVQNGGQSGLLRIYHINGVLAREEYLNSGQGNTQLDVGELPVGVYAIEFISEGNIRYFGKLIKQ